jgi:hypothetical protein
VLNNRRTLVHGWAGNQNHPAQQTQAPNSKVTSVYARQCSARDFGKVQIDQERPSLVNAIVFDENAPE